MEPEELGYNTNFYFSKKIQIPDGFDLGRIVAEHRERYVVSTARGEFEAEITGNLRFTAQSREDFPAVGDWVVLAVHDENFAIVHQVLPRYSVIKRQAVGKTGEVQVIAANIDYAFLVQAVDRDFNLNRLERYLTVCSSSKFKPVVVLTKTDLADQLRISEIKGLLNKRIPDVQVVAVSNTTKEGYEALVQTVTKGKTYCLLGSSGVGKSSLLNNLSGRTIMKTGNISDSTHKGRHVTSHRELVVLENGGILIDNPGMREVGVTDVTEGVEQAFGYIAELSQSCRYKDCTHTSETGCAVLEALEKGELEDSAYQNYLKIKREEAHFESTAAEKRRKEKIFGKVVKEYKKKSQTDKGISAGD